MQLHTTGGTEWLNSRMRVVCLPHPRRGYKQSRGPNEMIFCNQAQLNTPKWQLFGLDDSHLQHTHKFPQWTTVGMEAEKCFRYYIRNLPHGIIFHVQFLFPLLIASASVLESLNKRECYQCKLLSHLGTYLLTCIQFDTFHPSSSFITLET